MHWRREWLSEGKSQIGQAPLQAGRGTKSNLATTQLIHTQGAYAVSTHKKKSYRHLGREGLGAAGLDGPAVGPGNVAAGEGASGAHGLGARAGVRDVVRERNGHDAALDVLARLVRKAVRSLEGLAGDRLLLLVVARGGREMPLPRGSQNHAGGRTRESARGVMGPSQITLRAVRTSGLPLKRSLMVAGHVVVPWAMAPAARRPNARRARLVNITN